MSEDIVERLRSWRHDSWPADPSPEAAAEIERLREQLHLANIDALGAHAEANELRDALADSVALIERLIDTRRCSVSDLRVLNAARAALEAKP